MANIPKSKEKHCHQQCCGCVGHGLEAPVAYLQNYTTFDECIVNYATRRLRSEPYGEQLLRLKRRIPQIKHSRPEVKP